MDQSNDASEVQTQSSAKPEDTAQSGSAGSDAEQKPVLNSRTSNSSIPGSPKVQFGIGTKERDGSVKGVKRLKKKSFKDIVLKEVIATEHETNNSPPVKKSFGTPPLTTKSILKASKSEPLLPRTDDKDEKHSHHSFVNPAYEGDNNDDKHIPTANTFNTTNVATTKNSAKFPLLMRGESSSSKGFADVVDLLIQRSSIDLGGRDMHPFGRDCSIEGIMQASRPKSHSKNSAFGKLVIWMTLLSFLLGAACGIILLSENYNKTQREAKLIQENANYTHR